MLILLSPSKTPAEKPLPPLCAPSQPVLLEDAAQLAAELKKLSADAIGKLMDISEKLALLNHARFQQFHTPFTERNATQSIRLFKGDVYEGLDADSFSGGDMKAAQGRIRILSGLYGVLKPLDLMQPYRLEMGTGFRNARGKNLYAFWGDRVTAALNAEKPGFIVNLASAEYFKVIRPQTLDAKIIHCTFKEHKNGKAKVIGLFAKRARGLMARHIVKHRISDISGLKGFSEEGYTYRPEQSSDGELIFIRGEF